MYGGYLPLDIIVHDSCRTVVSAAAGKLAGRTTERWLTDRAGKRSIVSCRTGLSDLHRDPAHGASRYLRDACSEPHTSQSLLIRVASRPVWARRI